MKFYYLDTKFASGRYKGQTLEEVFEKDPEYIDNCLKEDDNFLITEEVLEELQTANPDYVFSDEANARRDEKEQEFDRSQDTKDDDMYDDDDFDDDDFDADFDDDAFTEEDFDEEDLDDLYDDNGFDDDDDFDGYDDSQEDSRWDRF